MPEIDLYVIVAALSGLILVSYIFSLISVKTRIPTVLMLLFLGIAIRETTIHFDIYRTIPLGIIQFFGVLGLIVILLEAGLQLRLSKPKLRLIGQASAASALILGLSVVTIAGIVHYLLGQSWLVGLVYAVPLSVISSTIVASSIDYLSESKREFLTYESSLSDILGILLFNFLIAGEMFDAGLIAINLISVVLAIGLSVVVSVLLAWLLVRAKVNVKAFLIFAVLLLLYAVGHIWNLPTLLAVLIFGLVINNWSVLRLPWLARRLSASDVEAAADTIKSVTIESAFVIRTFFFTLFGYTISLSELASLKVVLVGSLIVVALFAIRLLYLLIFSRQHILPELFFSPRGLVTIVLFYSIPASLTFDTFDTGVLFYVILLTTLIMMLGSIWFTPEEATRESEERSNRHNGRLRRLFRVAQKADFYE